MKLYTKTYKNTINHTGSSGGNSYTVIHGLGNTSPKVKLYYQASDATNRRNMVDFNYVASVPENRGYYVRNILPNQFTLDIYLMDGYSNNSDINITVEVNR